MSRGWHRAAVAYWWAALAISVAVSSYGNVRHATGVAPVEYLTEARWIAGSLPVVLLILVEGIAIGVRAGIAGWQRWMATGFVAILAAVVLASSYVGLLSLVRSTELFAGFDALNLGLAAVPDLLMVASTVYVMTLRSPADDEAVIKPVSAWSRIGGNLLAHVEQASAPTSTTVDEHAVVTVDDGPRPVPPAVDQAVSEAVDDDAKLSTTAVDDTDTLSTPTVTAPVVDESAQVNTANDNLSPLDDSDPAPSTTAEGDATFVDDSPVVDSHSVATTTDQAVVVDDATPSTTVDDRITVLATAVVDETRTKVDVTDVARVLDLRRDGLSMTAIADRVGIASHSTVSGLVKAAVRIDDDYAAAVGQQRRPALAAVRG